MKTELLKNLIKEAVREAIQEELKEVLLEAVKAPKVTTPQPIQENKTITSTTPPPVSQMDRRQSYLDIIGETGLNMNSSHAQGFGNKPFNPKGVGDTTSPNGALPSGEVNMDQIMGLMTNK
jgi:hypothetical protein|tara:strand:- start:70 stop:432 length:363 start_codon:yes stop_codon:yes gene_type:complete